MFAAVLVVVFAVATGSRDRCRGPRRNATGETALASGVRAGGLYLSPHHGRVGQERVSIGGELVVAVTCRIKARCSVAPVCADRCLFVTDCRTALFGCSLRRTELSESCTGVELDCSASFLAKPALVGICKEGFICRRTSSVVVGCCCKRLRSTRDSTVLGRTA